MNDERPDTVHGRLLEATHIAGYSFERACSELEWLLDQGRWKTVAGGYDDVNAFLATIDFSEFRVTIEQRRRIAKQLAAIQASQRATAKMLGVGLGTVQRALDPNGSQRPKLSKSAATENDPNGSPPAWSLNDAVRGANNQAAKDAKAGRRILMHERDAARIAELEPIEGKFRALVIDPPWDYEGLSIAGRAAPLYATMTQEELLDLDVAGWAEDDCHLYLWTTNNFITRAVALMRAWGFAHKTVLTWKKPRWGLGSYFRNSTEHVLFGVRGELRTRSDSIATHFEAPLGEHSEKPEAFYEIVRAASHGPYGEIFQRDERPDFANVFRVREAVG